MSFPANIEALRSGIAKRQSVAKAASDEASHRKRQRQKNQAIVEILSGLLDSWQDPDPGKYRDAYFFLDITLRQQVVVREFLSEDVKVYQTQKEWNEYNRTRSWHGANYDGVPYWYPVVNLNVVGRGECSKCKSAQPVIEHYVQTYDSPEGDAWLKEQFVLCLECNSTTTLKSETSDSRL
jgi:hypothetical protein